MKLDADQVISDVADLMDDFDELVKRDLRPTRRRGSLGYFRKADAGDDDEAGPKLREIRRRLRGGTKAADDAGDDDEASNDREKLQEDDDADGQVNEIRKSEGGGDDLMAHLTTDENLARIRQLAEQGDIGCREFLHRLALKAVKDCVSRPHFEDCGGAGYRALVEAERRLGRRTK